MRIGVITPVVTLNPRAHNAWERNATWDDVAHIARACDDLGVHHLTASEHIAVPATVEATRGVRYYDPVATLSALAAVTTRVRLATYVVVLGYHHPLELAKRYGTLDCISGGRVILGVGVGTLQEEFDALGAPFAGRGAHADEMLAVLRKSLSRREPALFPGLVVDPYALQDPLPIWVGGQSRRSLRRAVELADGWAPFRLSPPEVTAALAESGASDRDGFEVVLRTEHAVDPERDADGFRRELDALRGAGATIVNVRLVSRSREHWIDQLGRVLNLAG